MLILNVVPGVYYSCSFSHIELLISPSGKPLDNGWNTGDIFGRLPSTLPSLENLVLILWRLLSGQGLVEILNRSRGNIRELDLSGSAITGVRVEEGVNFLLVVI